MARLTSALLLSCLLVLLASPSQSAALTHGSPSAPRHLQHAQQLAHEKKRMIKVRQGNNDNIFQELNNGKTGNNNNGNTNGQTTDPNNPDDGTNGNGANGNANQQSSSSAAPTQSSSSAAATQSNGNLVDSLLNGGGSSTSASSSATSSSAASTSSAATSTANSVSLNLLTPTSTPSTASQTDAAQRTILSQSFVSSPTQTADQSNSSSSSFGRNSIIAIVVIASCVGGAAAIWTLIRKWKLGTSAKFDERLQPIEWNPEMEANAGGAGIPGGMREKDTASTLNEKHKRAGSTGSHGSFHSGDADHSLGRNVTGNGNMFADQNPSGYAPEAHDFTAGPTQQYGTAGYDAGAGYVDLQRSHSGSRGAELTRGPSVGHAAYGPEYDQGYGAHAGAYGHEAYAQDAYGGYDAYPAQQQYPQGTAPAADPYAHSQYPARY